MKTYTAKLAPAKLPVNAGNLTCSSQVKGPHIYLLLRGKHFAQNTRELPAAACKFDWIKRVLYRYFYMRNSCKFARD